MWYWSILFTTTRKYLSRSILCFRWTASLCVSLEMFLFIFKMKQMENTSITWSVLCAATFYNIHNCSRLYWTLLWLSTSVNNVYFNILCCYIFNEMVHKIYIDKITNKSTQISIVYSLHQIINPILVKYMSNEIFYYQKQLFLYDIIMNILIISCYYILNNYFYWMAYCLYRNMYSEYSGYTSAGSY
eukprot:380565_1